MVQANRGAPGQEFLSLAGQLLGLIPKEAANAVAWSTRAWVRFVLYFIGAPLTLVIIVGCAKMYWDLPGIVRWAPYFMPIGVLILLGTPAVSGLVSAIQGMLDSTATGVTGKAKAGLREYGKFLRIIVLWAIIIPIGILLVPIQDCPTAFWMFIPIVAGHELAFWSDWHNAPEDREFQKIIMKVLKAGIVICIVLPFFFSGVRVAGEHGYVTPKEDTADLEIRKTRNYSADILMAKRTKCVRAVTARIGNDHPALTKEDDAMIAECKTRFPVPAGMMDSITQDASGSCGYFTWCYWGKASALLIAGHLLLLIPLIWGGNKLFGKKQTVTQTSGTKTVVVNPAPSKPWLAIILSAVFVLGAFYFYATQTSSGYTVTERIVGKEDRVTQQDLRSQATAKYVRARITNPDHPYYDRLLDVQVGAGITERWAMNRMVSPNEDPTIIAAPNKNFYVLRQTGFDASGNLAYGNWVNTGSGETGAYTIAPNPVTGFLTATLSANGKKMEFEFKRFFQ